MFPELIPAEASGHPTPPARHAATPALFSLSEHAERRFWEFFTAHIRNPNTRLAYLSMSQRSIAAYTTKRPYDSTPFRSHARSIPDDEDVLTIGLNRAVMLIAEKEERGTS